MALTKGVSLIVIDYLQRITGEERNNKWTVTREREVAGMVAEIKSIAMDLNVPIILLSQLSRATESRESKIPALSDLRESGSIEQDADIVLLLYRAEYYLGRDEPPIDNVPARNEWERKMEDVRGKADIIVAKHRNGAIGKIQMGFNQESMKFYDL